MQIVDRTVYTIIDEELRDLIAVKEYNLGNKNNPIEINEFEYAIQMDETKSKL